MKNLLAKLIGSSLSTVFIVAVIMIALGFNSLLSISKEITYEELKSKPSQRKDGGWGSSGK